MGAAPLEDPEKFMEWLVSRAGKQAELARRAELAAETISDYVRGVHEPQLTNVLKMLRAVDVKIEGMPRQPDRLEAVEAKVDELATLVRQGFQGLEARIEQATPQRSRVAPPSENPRRETTG